MGAVEDVAKVHCCTKTCPECDNPADSRIVVWEFRKRTVTATPELEFICDSPETARKICLSFEAQFSKNYAARLAKLKARRLAKLEANNLKRLMVSTKRRRLTNQSLIDRFVRE